MCSNTRTSMQDSHFCTYQKQLLDRKMGWQYYRYRNYDPVVGRFWQVEPLVDSFPWLGYVFCENWVVNSVELEGLETSPSTQDSILGPYEIPQVTIYARNRGGFLNSLKRLWQNIRFQIRLDIGPQVGITTRFFSVMLNIASFGIIELKKDNPNRIDVGYFGQGMGVFVEQEIGAKVRFRLPSKSKDKQGLRVGLGGYAKHRFKGYLKGGYEEQSYEYGFLLGPLSFSHVHKEGGTESRRVLQFSIAIIVGLKVEVFVLLLGNKRKNKVIGNDK